MPMDTRIRLRYGLAAPQRKTISSAHLALLLRTRSIFIVFGCPLAGETTAVKGFCQIRVN
jgi:hypothetical protein